MTETDLGLEFEILAIGICLESPPCGDMSYGEFVFLRFGM
jgi:hypothetical protein